MTAYFDHGRHRERLLDAIALADELLDPSRTVSGSMRI